jgi:alanine racemase
MPFELPRRRALDHLIRPTRAEISQSALRANLETVRKLSAPAEVLAVVKANAYGHGAVHVARVLEDAGVAMLGVALVEEGIELRNAGVKAPILVMGGSYEGGYELIVEHALTPTVFRLEHLEGLKRAAQGRRVAVHLKLDSGMGRIGVLPAELGGLLSALKAAPDLELEGFLSQLASADVAGSDQTPAQLKVFHAGLKQVHDAGFKPRWRHLANSAGAMTQAKARDGHDINLVRPGLMLYGLVTAPWLEGKVKLRRVMTWKTGITHVKSVEAGATVSYGATWIAPKRSVLATLPVGYADGFSRTFSNRAAVLVRGVRAPVVGRVTMDMCVVDVTHVPGAAVGDEVVLLGGQGKERVDAEELAALMDTLHYEVLCGVGARVPRLLVP